MNTMKDARKALRGASLRLVAVACWSMWGAGACGPSGQDADTAGRGGQAGALAGSGARGGAGGTLSGGAGGSPTAGGAPTAGAGAGTAGGGGAPSSGGGGAFGGASGQPTPGAKASATLIKEAHARGELDEEQALLYEVFALFKDPRLPAHYRGDDEKVFESDALGRAIRRFDGLSLETQKQLVPFLMRPSEPGSWASPNPVTLPSTSAAADDAPPLIADLGLVPSDCTGNSSPFWTSVTTPSAHVQVWWDSRDPDDQEKAVALLDIVETLVWPKLITALGLKEPLSDANPVTGKDCAGSDGRLDIYLADIGARGLTVGRDLASRIRCQALPAMIYINRSSPGSVRTASVAHEVMHAIQYAYDAKACTDDYGWLKDATATWAIDHVLSGTLLNDQFEQNYAPCYLTTPEKALDDRSNGKCNDGFPRDYGAYLFFQFMTKRGSPALMKAVFDNLEGYASSLEVVARVSSAGGDYLRDNWSEVAKALLNVNLPQNALKPNFRTWDDLGETAQLMADETWSNVSDKRFVFTPAINNLSVHYYQFHFPDMHARSLLFRNGFFKQYQEKKAIRVTAVWGDDTGKLTVEDWSKYQFVGLCRDRKNQRTSELLIIVSNGEWQASGGGTLSTSEPFFLEASSIGCWKYSGPVTCRTETGGATAEVTSQLSYVLDPRAPGLMDTHPAIPDSLRTGLHLLMPLGAEGSYTAGAQRAGGNCPYTFGPVSAAIGAAEAGVLQLNTFPHLEIPASGGDLVTFIGRTARSYRLSAQSRTVYLSNPTGESCSKEPIPLVLAATDDKAPPVVGANGTISLATTLPGFSCTGTLDPVTER